MEYTEKKTYKLTPFGVKLKQAGITCYKLGKACGVPAARLASWARGKARPTVGRELAAVLEYLDWHGVNIDISVDFIMEAEPKREPRKKKVPVPRIKGWKEVTDGM